jgi:hypothetical protein
MPPFMMCSLGKRPYFHQGSQLMTSSSMYTIEWIGRLMATITTPLSKECEDEIHTPKMGTWESAWISKTSEFDCRGQNTLYWGVFHTIGKLSKRRCRKWVYMSHLDICNTSYGKKKVGSQIGNLTPDHQKSRIDLTPRHAGGVWQAVGKFSTRATSLIQSSSQLKVWAKSYDSAKWWESKPKHFRDSSLGVPG